MRHRLLPLAILSVSLAVSGLWLNGCQQKAKDEPAPAAETGSTASSTELYARAEAAYMAGRYDEAAALLRDFPAGSAETALAKNLSGLTHARLGNPGMAEIEFQAALAADPNLKNAHYNLAVLRLTDGRLDQAETGFKSALASDPYYAAAHQGLAEVYQKQGRTNEAKAEQRMAAELAAKQPASQAIADLELQSLTVGQMDAPAETPAPAKKPAAKPKPKPAAPPAPTTVEVQASAPAGTQFGVAIANPISSANATVGQEVTGRLTGNISDGENVIARSGAAVKGRVTQAKSSGRVSGRGELAIAFTSVETVNGWRDIDAPLAQGVMIAEGTKKQDAAKVGIGAAAGAVLGEIIADDAGKGAVVGGAAGAATVLATRGKQVELTAGSEVQAKLSAPLSVTITKTRS
jgi:hypothetical protein